MTPARWFYVEAGQQRGPIDFDELVDLLRTEKLPADTLVWSPGRNAWTPADTVVEISAKLPPPLPGAAPRRSIPAEPPPIPESTVPTAPGHNTSPISGSPTRLTGSWLMLSALILLLADAGACVYLLSRPMKDPEKVGRSFGEMFMRLVFLSVIVTSIIPQLRKRFLASSLLLFAIPMAVFLGIVAHARIANDRLAGHMTEVSGLAQSFLDGAKQPDVPPAKPLSPDNPLLGMQTFLTDLSATLDSMNKEFDAVGAANVFDLEVMGQPKLLAVQLDARRQQQQILQSYQEVVFSKIDAWELKLPEGMSEEMRIAMEKGSKEGIGKGRVKQQQMFALRLREVEAEKRFLEFMLRTIGEYDISEGKLVSPGDEWSHTYRTLAQTVVDVRKEKEEYAAAQIQQAEKELETVKQLAPAR